MKPSMSAESADEGCEQFGAGLAGGPDFRSTRKHEAQCAAAPAVAGADLGEDEATPTFIRCGRRLLALPAPEGEGRVLDAVLLGKGLAAHAALHEEVEDLFPLLAAVVDTPVTAGLDQLDGLLGFFVGYHMYDIYHTYHTQRQRCSV